MIGAGASGTRRIELLYAAVAPVSIPLYEEIPGVDKGDRGRCTCEKPDSRLAKITA
jgi:hypothetical protein